MVHDGYRALDHQTGRALKGATPPPEWNAGQHAWGFTYSRPGSPSRFRLQVALQAATRRVFVHACELDSKGEPLPSNIQASACQAGARGVLAGAAATAPRLPACAAAAAAAP